MVLMAEASTRTAASVSSTKPLPLTTAASEEPSEEEKDEEGGRGGGASGCSRP